MRPKFTLSILILLLLSSCDHKTKPRINLQNDKYVDSVYLFYKNKNLQNQIKFNDSLNMIVNQIVNLTKTNRNKNDKKLVHEQISLLKQDENRLINQLNKLREQSFAYDRHFPIEDIKNCLDDTLERKLFINHLSCLNCNRKSEDLLWIHFKSPEYTWKNLMGREGPLSICEKCKIPIEFITERMN